MQTIKPIKNALISVYYKEGLEPIIAEMKRLGVIIYSTGGTQDFLEKQGIEVMPVEDLTGYPSILGGRVKTLHPKVFGGILGRRENETDMAEMQQYEIPELDLIIVDLYPFEETVKSGAVEVEIIEKIDIGGVSLIRAAAKNFMHAAIVSSKNEYGFLLGKLQSQSGTTLEDRRHLCKQAFFTTAQYDSEILKYFSGNPLEFQAGAFGSPMGLRYGENPHQQGAFFGDTEKLFEQLNGKELSYNNLVDVEAAMELVNEFEKPSCVIIKHTNACGAAERETALDAWRDALAGDPVSAFGGVVAFNREIDAAVAKEIDSIFFELLIAPAFTNEAIEILKSKKNRIVLKLKKFSPAKYQHKSLLGGVLVQQKDIFQEQKTHLKTTTEKAPTEAEINDLLFALRLVKHTKSNTIVLAKNRQLLGSGCGMTSRVDALKHAIKKSQEFGFDLKGAVMASDAFFPFPDCVEIANESGIKAVVQPGGSVKDQLSIDYCNQHQVAMVFTGIRHFKH
ncbi:MAG: bifunctional phosphoribosylaminoimidazolecarboxamide formyltransferase/IMP cyclohydrolase [Flavobacteriaceae bacterium]|nr:bifunctional phosphoribosylaminoimidazolecarboxamide formyltransferase/IMP cyclohydrolase [Flavobacteriaceae bacterium]